MDTRREKLEALKKEKNAVKGNAVLGRLHGHQIAPGIEGRKAAHASALNNHRTHQGGPDVFAPGYFHGYRYGDGQRGGGQRAVPGRH